MKIGTILDAFFVEKTLRKFYFRLIMPIGCDSSPLGSKILFILLSLIHLHLICSTYFSLSLALSLSLCLAHTLSLSLFHTVTFIHSICILTNGYTHRRILSNVRSVSQFISLSQVNPCSLIHKIAAIVALAIYIRLSAANF